MEIGYTELEANNIKEELLNDQSGSAGDYNQTPERNVSRNRRQQHVTVYSESNRGAVDVGSNGNRNSREDGRGISPEVASQPGGRTELNTNSQKADSTDEPAFSMPKQNGQAYVDSSHHTDLYEQYKSGKITGEQYQAELAALPQ